MNKITIYVTEPVTMLLALPPCRQLFSLSNEDPTHFHHFPSNCLFCCGVFVCLFFLFSSLFLFFFCGFFLCVCVCFGWALFLCVLFFGVVFFFFLLITILQGKLLRNFHVKYFITNVKHCIISSQFLPLTQKVIPLLGKLLIFQILLLK